jgi:hypothetical protein
MKLGCIVTLAAATLLVGCTKCQQQPVPESAPPAESAMPPTEAPPTEVAPADPGAAELAPDTNEKLPESDEMNRELPPETK